MVAISRTNPTRKKSQRERNVPSQAAIRRETAAIRSHWSNKTRRRRSGQALDFLAVFELPTTPRRKGFEVE